MPYRRRSRAAGPAPEMPWADDFSGRGFRASPLYELVPFERLSAAERQALAALPEIVDEPGAYGLLRPRGAASGLSIKSADRDTALLFLTLREPGPLPAYVRRAFGDRGLRAVARLVADGVLEVDGGDGFVSGAAALPWLTEAPAARAAGGRLAALSLAALRYAHALAVDDPLVLAGRLYGYNTLPLTPRWRRLLASDEAAGSWLGIAPGGPNRRRLARHWEALPPSSGWLHWTARAPARPGASGAPEGSSPTWKLYVSPLPAALPESFGAVLDALAVARPLQFKIGARAAGLLRPDKIVAYFGSFERLAEGAAALGERLRGVPVQGVPFTAEIGGDGLVSWGVDPPASERSPWGGRESWRFWLAHRLARALLAARSEAGPEPWRFALERLRLEGIDTGTWAPGALLWKEG